MKRKSEPSGRAADYAAAHEDAERERAEPGAGGTATHREYAQAAALEMALRQMMRYGGPRGRYDWLAPVLHGLLKEKTLLDLSLRGDASARALRQTADVQTPETVLALPRLPDVPRPTPARGMRAVG